MLNLKVPVHSFQSKDPVLIQNEGSNASLRFQPQALVYFYCLEFSLKINFKVQLLFIDLNYFFFLFRPWYIFISEYQVSHTKSLVQVFFL
jgi:hypothetical protein